VGLSIHTLGRSYDSALTTRKQASLPPGNSVKNTSGTNPKPQDEQLAEDVGTASTEHAEALEVLASRPYYVCWTPNCSGGIETVGALRG